ncbi:MAG: secondary thiamine-phosphate synthase enzyme YjbQ [candidate division KSB1 bacterium]|nr:secondary thiamine-phosphate synthase enzyme YjbQ [candidate division KSB1 bacterium]
MAVKTERISFSTKGFTDIHDITPQVRTALKKAGLQNGSVTVFVSGSTAGVTTIEYEPGLLKDLPTAFEKIAPMGIRYHHDDTWGDGNGYAHVRAALLGASVVVPFENGTLLLGTWQQIVLVDFDNRARRREVILQFIGD